MITNGMIQLLVVSMALHAKLVTAWLLNSGMTTSQSTYWTDFRPMLQEDLEESLEARIRELQTEARMRRHMHESLSLAMHRRPCKYEFDTLDDARDFMDHELIKTIRDRHRPWARCGNAARKLLHIIGGGDWTNLEYNGEQPKEMKVFRKTDAEQLRRFLEDPVERRTLYYVGMGDADHVMILEKRPDGAMCLQQGCFASVGFPRNSQHYDGLNSSYSALWWAGLDTDDGPRDFGPLTDKLERFHKTYGKGQDISKTKFVQRLCSYLSCTTREQRCDIWDALPFFPRSENPTYCDVSEITVKKFEVLFAWEQPSESKHFLTQHILENEHEEIMHLVEKLSKHTMTLKIEKRMNYIPANELCRVVMTKTWLDYQ